MKFARLLLRLVVGALFVGHGTQKLFGWFGGYGLDATAQGFEKMGARPGRLNAIAASTTETAGGAMLALGLATPLAAAGLVAVMLTAINRVHLKNGLWNSNGGYEFNLVLIAAALALAETGPGPLSVDRDRFAGPGWALAALLGGIAGAAGAHAYSAMQPEPQTEPTSEPTQATAAEPETAGATG
jgi:putative oxidoreductase